MRGVAASIRLFPDNLIRGSYRFRSHDSSRCCGLAAGPGVGRDDGMSLTIWTNHVFRPEALAAFEQGLRAGGHRLVISPAATASVLAAGAADPTLAEADVAFGQPDVAQVLGNSR